MGASAEHLSGDASRFAPGSCSVNIEQPAERLCWCRMKSLARGRLSGSYCGRDVALVTFLEHVFQTLASKFSVYKGAGGGNIKRRIYLRSHEKDLRV